MKIAILQTDLNGSRDDNCAKVESLIRDATAQGAAVVLPPELFAGRYFCQEQDSDCFSWAQEHKNSALLTQFQSLAKELNVVLPVSFFERAGQSFFNSVVVFDANGADLGIYRKSHIPDGPGYQEKFYFRPGDTGFKVFDTKVGRIGVGICWDQWFPECARSLTLQGAEILLYPTAIGSEPEVPEVDSCKPWQRVMQGHAVANSIPVAAANRIGTEANVEFFGASFVCDHRGEMLQEMSGTEDGFRIAEINLTNVDRYRVDWGFFRDRRPDLYGEIVK